MKDRNTYEAPRRDELLTALRGVLGIPERDEAAVAAGAKLLADFAERGEGIPLAEAEKAQTVIDLGAADDTPLSDDDGALSKSVKAIKDAIDAKTKTVDLSRFVKTDGWVNDPPPRQWLIPDVLPEGRFTLLSGPGENGKSRLVIQLALGMARGEQRWLPNADRLKLLQLHSRSTVFVTWEDEHDEFRRRMPHAYAEHAEGRIHVLDLATLGPLWAPPEGQSGHTSTRAELTPVGRAVRRYCEEVKAALLVIDPVAAAFAVNENDRALVRPFISDWDGWARKNGVAVLVLGHPPKSDHAYSGSTDWRNAPRTVMELNVRPIRKADANNKKCECQALCLRSEKSNIASRRFDPVWLVRDNVGWAAAGNKVEAADDYYEYAGKDAAGYGCACADGARRRGRGAKDEDFTGPDAERDAKAYFDGAKKACGEAEEAVKTADTKLRNLRRDKEKADAAASAALTAYETAKGLTPDERQQRLTTARIAARNERRANAAADAAPKGTEGDEARAERTAAVSARIAADEAVKAADEVGTHKAFKAARDAANKYPAKITDAETALAKAKTTLARIREERDAAEARYKTAKGR